MNLMPVLVNLPLQFQVDSVLGDLSVGIISWSASSMRFGWSRRS